ncbi:MAG: hypothetical protein K0S86_2579 [Geminicoccaceae bacterium]|jgi:hypothetical protein|nr:hypothetical protein [Geminicoccaceae bacterium]
MLRFALVVALLGAAPLSGQTTDVDARDRAILAAALLEAPREGKVWARLNKVKDWVSVGPRRTMPVVFPTRNSTPTKLAPPPPANRVSRP